jgi:hypothetical protein
LLFRPSTKTTLPVFGSVAQVRGRDREMLGHSTELGVIDLFEPFLSDFFCLLDPVHALDHLCSSI